MTELGTKASEDDTITVDGKAISLPKQHRYLMLNKPPGLLTTRHDEAGRRTIYSLLHEHDFSLHPVGRLDLDSCGLLLLTTDGELTHRLTHPRYEVPKTYRVETQPWPKKGAMFRLRKGVELEDGLAVPDAVAIVGPGTWEITLSEGRNREIRRIMAALNFEVTWLQRVRQGPVSLGSLREGHFRKLSPVEVEGLRKAAGLAGE